MWDDVSGRGSTAAVPLKRQGVPIGALIVNRKLNAPFSASQMSLLETFADQAVIAIENARLFNELESEDTKS